MIILVFSTAGSSNGTSSTSSTTQQNNSLVSKAKSMGCDITACYTYDSNNNCTGINLQKVNQLIKDAETTNAETEEETSSSESESDTFVRTENGSYEKKEKEYSEIEVESAKHTVDSDYTKAAQKYSDSMDVTVNNSTEAGQLTESWNKMETEEKKLTGVLTSDTTIMEGVKKFVTSLTNLSNDTENYENSNDMENDESTESLTEDSDVPDEQNNISDYETETNENILGINPFLGFDLSPFEISDNEEEYAV